MRLIERLTEGVPPTNFYIIQWISPKRKMMMLTKQHEGYWGRFKKNKRPEGEGPPRTLKRCETFICLLSVKKGLVKRGINKRGAELSKLRCWSRLRLSALASLNLVETLHRVEYDGKCIPLYCRKYTFLMLMLPFKFVSIFREVFRQGGQALQHDWTPREGCSQPPEGETETKIRRGYVYLRPGMGKLWPASCSFCTACS